MKKISVFLLGTLLMLTSCAPTFNDDEVVQNTDDETANQQPSIVPSYQLSDETYKMILPYRPSASRGVIVNQMGNRLDIDEMEEGLRRHSKAFFDPGKYFFEEGQYLTQDLVYEWLGRKLTEEQLKEAKENTNQTEAELQNGLNPPLADNATQEDYRNSPRYLSHILEQNFLKKDENNEAELVGISIGLALKSEYRFQTEIGGPYFNETISKETMLEQGKAIAQTILERLRTIEELANVPIMIALYQEEDQGSPVPGNYVAKTEVKAGDMTIDEWSNIKEEYILFPSVEASEKYYDDQNLVNNFANEVAHYFPNYVGVIGEGFYINEELKKLTLEIPIEFYGKGEVIGFTQYAYGLVKEMFPDYYDLEIKVMSTHKMESLIYRSAGVEDPTVHIFH